MILFSLRTPHIHTRKIQAADRGHVRVAPVICQLITRLSNSQAVRDDKTERDSEQRLSRVCFSLIWENQKLESAGSEAEPGAPILGSNWSNDTEKDSPLPRGQTLPLGYRQLGCSFLKPPAWPLVKKTEDRWLLREPGDRLTDSKVVTIPQTYQGQRVSGH